MGTQANETALVAQYKARVGKGWPLRYAVAMQAATTLAECRKVWDRMLSGK